MTCAHVIESMIDGGTPKERSAIVATLRRYPAHLLETCAAAGTRIRPLKRSEKYIDVSADLKRLGVDVNAWPVAPTGLFVVADRTLYLREVDAMTVAHEFGHAIDAALGGGTYLSGFDPEIRKAFAQARDFVTCYAATGLDEYFAEGCRAMVGVNAPPPTFWPVVSEERLKEKDAAFHAVLARLFVDQSLTQAA